MSRFMGLVGIVVFVLLGWALSRERKAIHWRTVGWALALQVDKQAFVPVNAAAVRPGNVLVAQSQHFTNTFGVEILKSIAAEKPRH